MPLHLRRASSDPCGPPSYCPVADRLHPPLNPISSESPLPPPPPSETDRPEISTSIPLPTLPSASSTADLTSKAPTPKGNPPAPVPGSNPSGNPNGGLIGGVLGAVLGVIFILAVLLCLWTKEKKSRSSQFARDDRITDMGFGKTNERPYHELWLEDAEAYGSKTSTRMDTPRRCSTSDLTGNPTLSQHSEPGSAGLFETLSKGPSSTSETSHLIPPTEMMASIPLRENVTPELADIKRHFRVDLPLNPERNPINLPGKFQAVPATSGAATLQVAPQLSLTTPEGIVVGSNLNVSRSRSGRAVQHVMSFMSFIENRQQGFS
ncbi:hypothetical protein EMCG_07588 [[Emmonsia] crescens]|uniref:Uncharacterized protein n=1 Tax=[Emmonsia] crescens TaxID=73230 RepID=A0A0G2I803_9EURO|nr:hypothetical protein EMCG_07588 [Emmonsia crescens UAMH 3008]